ncbi:methyltransferase-like protein 9 [Agrilus planipennis]|uniref:Methyltransferase-like protein 9 n=1 Tax=Agrilus planipennis TaxID=224129 RepID=A0A1W4WKL0_AGRPL|nr:methyltransferase-like protein 9 [Agrilus planipennis]XP_018324443.1 methyltransferase-like protein 9 [Agrilus planipennis]XP_018324444.1 methyltransferase-like protein 9 [Agrilus planipennis]
MTTYLKPRSSLARALYEKQKIDDYLTHFDKSQWYKCNLTKLSSEITSHFVQLNVDEETSCFLKQSEEKSDWIFTQLWHSIAKVLLGWFMTQTSVNGWLERGSMFVLSHLQFLSLMSCDGDWDSNSLLDLGAGDGKVTANLAPAFEQVFVTEVSHVMRKHLQKRKFKVLGIEDWQRNNKFNVISCLNLLDRCDKPLTLLKDIKDTLTPNGRLIVALVLPFSSYVETGSLDHTPSEKLPIRGSTFEEQVECIINDVFKPLGFILLTWSKVPYLCEGDLRQSYYWLNDAIFIFKNAQ